MKEQIIKNLKILTLALVVGPGVNYAFAWTGPTATPPNGNVSAPINVGSVTQKKDGGFKAFSLRSFDKSYINYADAVNLTTKPASFQGLSLAVNGRTGATEYCDENGENCYTTSQMVGGGGGNGNYTISVSNEVGFSCDRDEDDNAAFPSCGPRNPYGYAQRDINLGVHTFCSLTRVGEAGADAGCRVIKPTTPAGNWRLRLENGSGDGETLACAATCLDIVPPLI